MFSAIHNYFSRGSYSRYDFINAMLMGLGIGLSTLWPLAIVVVLFALTFIKPTDGSIA